MRQKLRVLGAVTVVALGAGTVGACDGPWKRTTFEDDAAVPGKITSVRLENRSGGIALHGRQGLAKVTLHRSVSYRDHRPDGPTHRVEGGVLVLGGCGDRCSVGYTADIPAGIPVTGGVSSGAITLSAVGGVRVTASSGRITLDGTGGPVSVRTSSGRIRGTGLRGGKIEARTSNGAIDLAPATPSDVRAQTSNGAIKVTVPAGRYRVSAKTSHGGKHIGVADDPAGAHRLDLTTSNGAITVKTA
ncbi:MULTISPECIES: DUF4097 family beta strand repeat-containing protein [Thermomonosporaceae]|uniref:DUF4097 family beta strand repeat-containing protein n=1 Tax=Thermomonosporaceae TaxID=2012 RepID=UPI00255B1E94|nr:MULTISPECIES: DUF4097 family beta strand repeat-containing protein [Thermomonosporaceae]MDL4775380.1 DUF4097 family beta strand repeat-containing protein [Actinomadura xylanilytica]